MRVNTLGKSRDTEEQNATQPGEQRKTHQQFTYLKTILSETYDSEHSFPSHVFIWICFPGCRSTLHCRHVRVGSATAPPPAAILPREGVQVYSMGGLLS